MSRPRPSQMCIRDRLEEIIKKLEAGDSTLEESFTCYEAGMKLVKYLSGQIDLSLIHICLRTYRGEAQAGPVVRETGRIVAP